MESDLQNLLTLKDSILEEIEALKISQATIMDQFTGIKTQIDAKQTDLDRCLGAINYIEQNI